MENQYSYFDDPEFVKRQKELEKMKDELYSIEKESNEVKTDVKKESEKSEKKEKDNFLEIGKDLFKQYGSKLFQKKEPDGFSTDHLNNVARESKSNFGFNPGKTDFGSEIDFKQGDPGNLFAQSNEYKSGLDMDSYATKDFLSDVETPDSLGSEVNNGIEAGGHQINAAGTAMAGIGLATSTFNATKNTSQSEKESIAGAADLTLKSAQLGLQLGGPWGAAIGGAAGLTYGVIDGFADANKRGKMEREANKKKFLEDKMKREQEYRISEGEDSLQKLTRLRKAQMDYLI